MTLTELKYVVAVAREGSFSAAAAACYVSKPTLSVAVRKLEQDLGVALFERRHGEIAVTEAGERVVAQAKRVLAEAQVLREIASEDRDQLVAPLRLGSIYSIGPYLFPYLITELAKVAPNMPLVIEECYPNQLKDALLQGHLDAVLVSLPFEANGVVTLPLYQEPLVVALPKSHPLAMKAEVSAEELSGETLLLLERGHCFRDEVLAIWPEKGGMAGKAHDVHVGQTGEVLEGGSLDTISYMVASGLGVSVLPCTASRANCSGDSLVAVRPFAGETPKRTVALAWRKSFPRSKAISVVRDALLKIGAECLNSSAS